MSTHGLALADHLQAHLLCPPIRDCIKQSICPPFLKGASNHTSFPMEVDGQRSPSHNHPTKQQADGGVLRQSRGRYFRSP